MTVAAARGQVLTVLHPFSALDAVARTNSDGAKPLGGLTQGWDGSFYGTTEVGGTNGTGTIFKITPGGSFVLVHTFSAFDSNTNADGAYPDGSLVRGSDGTLYGTAGGGGAYGNYGTVFKITTNDAFVLLHSFDYSSGENPDSSLILAGDGYLYGTAVLGGSGGNGTLFQISTNGDFQAIYEFTSSAPLTPENYTNADGSRPYGLTQCGDGNFYGTTELGGSNGNGTVFQFTTNGVFNLLHTFSPQAPVSGTNADGAGPQAPLTQGLDGGFYGTTPYGGTNSSGTIFRVTAGGGFSTVHSFDFFNDGANSYSPLLLYHGRFIGTA
ncbi:MAG: choice-of-anchor tandem repeat GloVer-containing protein, partial [Bryobacteraceae bacterium]